MQNDGILLESGTNEVEILEFLVAGRALGVNVAKVQAITEFDPRLLTRMPMAPTCVAGMLLFRGRTIPLIHLRREFKLMEQTQAEPIVRSSDRQVALCSWWNSTMP